MVTLLIIVTMVTLLIIVTMVTLLMENSLLAIFGEIWPMTMYYSTGTLARFWSNFKNS